MPSGWHNSLENLKKHPLYSEPGFGKWLSVFSDTYTNRAANDIYSKFIADKIRQRVHDPELAESLVPKDHGFGTRRVPLESGYFEVYNQSNVHLVDLKKTPIERITTTGIETKDGKTHELDVLICATGFNAITGAFANIKWSGKGQRTFVASTDSAGPAIWPDHRPQTLLGIMAPAMPNLFMILGPHQSFGNTPRSIERAVLVVMDILQHLKANNCKVVEPRQEAVDKWTEHVHQCSEAQVLVNEVDSWMTGVNTNVEGKKTRTVARYMGSAVEFRRRCEMERNSGFPGLNIH